MKFKITLKDPDGFSDDVQDAVDDEVDALNLEEDEEITLKEIKVEKLNNFLERWFKYNEYLTVEVDTEAGTCVVVEQK